MIGRSVARRPSRCGPPPRCRGGQNDVNGAHQAYVWALARQAKADGMGTELEHRDLATVCELLGVDPETLGHVLDAPTPAISGPQGAQEPTPGALAGKTVSFTGELLGTIKGAVSHERWPKGTPVKPGCSSRSAGRDEELGHPGGRGP